MALEDFDVETVSVERGGGLADKFHEEVDRQAHVRGHQDRGFVGRFVDFLALAGRVAGGGDDQWNAAGDADGQDGHRSLGHGEVNDDVEALVERHVRADRCVDGADTDDFADVTAKLRVAGVFQGRAEDKVLVLARELNDALTHAAAGAVHAEDGFHRFALSLAMLVTTPISLSPSGSPKLALHRAFNTVCPCGWLSPSTSS